MAASTRQTGEHSRVAGQYSMTSAGGFLGSTPAVPARGGFASGSMFRNQRVQFTNTTDAQNAPSAPFKILVRMDQEKRVDLINQGDIMWGVDVFGCRDQRNGVIRAKALWDLNLSLRESHEHWQRTYENCTTIEDAMNSMRFSLAHEFHGKIYGRDNEDVSELDFFELIELNNTVQISKFLRQCPYIGPVMDPNGTQVKEGNRWAGQAGSKLFLMEAEGRIPMPNIFRASMPGTEVGFLVTKFTNPHVLAADVDLDWRGMINAMAPLQVWPVSNFNRKFPTCGIYSDVRASGAAMPLSFGGNEFCWNERDPTKIQACHWDYEGSVYRPDEHSAGVLDTRLVMRPSYYFGIGTVDSTVPGVPSVEEISEAVSPRQTRFDPNTMWNRLMEQYKIQVFCRNPTWDMIQQIDRMDEM